MQIFLSYPAHGPYRLPFECVQVHFVDGTAFEARTFKVADLGIPR